MGVRVSWDKRSQQSDQIEHFNSRVNHNGLNIWWEVTTSTSTRPQSWPSAFCSLLKTDCVLTDGDLDVGISCDSYDDKRLQTGHEANISASTK
mgnify:CR=1 FL=1